MDIFRMLERIRLFVSPGTIPGWVPLIWWVVKRAGDFDTLVTAWGWGGDEVIDFIGNWGWAVGLVWIVFFVVIGNPFAGRSKSIGQLPLSGDKGAIPQALEFHPERVLTSISQVRLDGLLAQQKANECIRIRFDVVNHNDVPIRVKAVAGEMLIGSEPQYGNLKLESAKPDEIPPGSRGTIVLLQVSDGLRDRLYTKLQMFGKDSVTPFNFANVKLVCDVDMDGDVKEVQLQLSANFLLRGPLRDNEDYKNVNPQTPSFGSNNWYGSDGPNEKWWEAK